MQRKELERERMMHREANRLKAALKPLAFLTKLKLELQILQFGKFCSFLNLLKRLLNQRRYSLKCFRFQGHCHVAYLFQKGSG